MSEKIKLVYSWIGPRGPIWNTELPNILSFADVSEHAQVNSHRFWSDDAWTTLFSHAPDEYEIYPAVGMSENDTRPFIYPFSLAWRVNFEHYFCGDTGIMEFAHMPWHLVRLLREQNGYILINHSVEAFMSHGYMNAMHGYFKGIHNLPLHKIIYLTGCINAKEIYEEYCLVNNIPEDKQERLTIVSYPSSQNIFRPNIGTDEDEPFYDDTIVPEKLFLMWNRRYRSHRLALSLYLEEKNLIDRSYISFSDRDIERPTIEFKKIVTPDIVVHLYPWLYQEVIDRFSERLPLVIDGETNINQMCEDRGNESRPFYQNSLVSIITETNFEQSEVTLTEKSYKPIKEKHPFIIVGAPGAIKGMQDAGFQTFNEFWDESYDNLKNPGERMLAIMRIISDIATWDNDKILDFRRRVKPILDNNFRILKDSSPKTIVSYLSDIVRNNK